MAQVTVCDICDSRQDVRKMYLPVGRESDGAGSMDTVGVNWDLCAKCEVLMWRINRNEEDSKRSRDAKFDANNRLCIILKKMQSRAVVE